MNISNVFRVRCHCGRVEGTFKCDRNAVALDCNCSDCGMRGNINLVIAKENFQLVTDEKLYEQYTSLYQWGTKTAVRRFCKSCGILPWYNPRSKPDGTAINLNCVDWGDDLTCKPNIQIVKFDGIHWEDSFAELKRNNLLKARECQNAGN
mmetsp:Transcript_3770/g.4623  ORF Transcript_3770/g.4623 Transcript_3770/m.4623 type:complete len:150 (-) Transcript_3770:101-550(-)|eukprot:CAMPEP_0203673466 /NCGR_PEP_ID=MMETSP0090-20130426/12667_1 /ASSEMBLY_ACC=CAM_ASM_001088 /TAXON_ID=426623 /ORGANISM="Chaetoceros affinis, Strain CCMP159" /LENGTH=149 /DNA_ID=CAMNT_0050539137 /DNA_START=64 /DNA_END=513 /DNA_ORIENTATION=-